jgi:hypothetical protein
MDATELPLAEDLMVGADDIGEFIYGPPITPKKRRDIYRNPFGFSFFKHGNALAAFKSTIRAELAAAQQAAREANAKRRGGAR